MAKNKTAIVAIVEKKFFVHRVVTDNEKLGAYLYDFYIDLLKSSGKELEQQNHYDVSLFAYVESSNNVRYFEIPEKLAVTLEKFARQSMREALDAFAADMRKDGTNLLKQLNAGNITLDELNKAATEDS